MPLTNISARRDGHVPGADCRDQSFIGRSPCLTCDRRDQNKNKCVNNCEKIKKMQTSNNSGFLYKPPKARKKHTNDICLIDGCNRCAKSSGLCIRHYNAWNLGRIEHPIVEKYQKVHYK